jgi:hypothetical protein
MINEKDKLIRLDVAHATVVDKVSAVKDNSHLCASSSRRQEASLF